MPDISCIIVTYWNEETIGNCLKSIEADLTGYSAEIILIDNASGDQSVSIARSILNHAHCTCRIIENLHNLGFARGVNQGLAAARGDYILILNPDTILHEGFFAKSITFLKENPEIGLVAPKQVTSDGKILPSCREFPTHISLLFYVTGIALLFPESRKINAWKMGYFDHLSSRIVQQPMGACLLTRRKDFSEVGYMDERFWMFFNDVDWCLRFHRAGKKAYFLADAVITHSGGHSIYKNRIRMVLSSHRAFGLYFLKYYRGFRWIIPNVVAGMALTVTGIFRAVFPLFNPRIWRHSLKM